MSPHFWNRPSRGSGEPHTCETLAISSIHTLVIVILTAVTITTEIYYSIYNVYSTAEAKVWSPQFLSVIIFHTHPTHSGDSKNLSINLNFKNVIFCSSWIFCINFHFFKKVCFKIFFPDYWVSWQNFKFCTPSKSLIYLMLVLVRW